MRRLLSTTWRSTTQTAVIAAAGGIESLVLLARDGGAEEQPHATNALRVLVVNNDENLVAVSKAAALAGLAVDGLAPD